MHVKLENSERTLSQLEGTSDNTSQFNYSELQANLKKKERELKKLKAAEKARVRQKFGPRLEPLSFLTLSLQQPTYYSGIPTKN